MPELSLGMKEVDAIIDRFCQVTGQVRTQGEYWAVDCLGLKLEEIQTRRDKIAVAEY